ncbi:unnamed protein product [Acidithrix sp. C25]|nr:unnamed protein product [Acidithrix sp. C25]
MNDRVGSMAFCRRSLLYALWDDLISPENKAFVNWRVAWWLRRLPFISLLS